MQGGDGICRSKRGGEEREAVVQLQSGKKGSTTYKNCVVLDSPNAVRVLAAMSFKNVK